MANVGRSNVEIDSHVSEVLEASDQAMELTLDLLGQVAEGHAAALAPVDTGRLKNSITHIVEPETRSVHIGTNVEYAIYQELGTSRMPPYKGRGYLRPAIMDNIDEYKRVIEENLKTEE